MEGETLTRYGNGFRVARGEAGDEIYRIMIKVKIIAMLAAGDLDTIILSAASLFGVSAEDISFQEVYPAKIYLYIDEDKLDQEHKNVADTIAGLMKRIKTTGVGIRIFYKTYSSKRAAVYVGTPTCIAAFINVAPMPLNKKSVKTIELKAGIGTLVCTRVSYPAIPREV